MRSQYNAINDLEEGCVTRPERKQMSLAKKAVGALALTGCAALLLSNYVEPQQPQIHAQFANPGVLRASPFSQASLLEMQPDTIDEFLREKQFEQQDASLREQMEDQYMKYYDASFLENERTSSGFSTGVFAGVAMAMTAAGLALTQRGKRVVDQVKEMAGFKEVPRPKIAMMAIDSLAAPDTSFKPVLDYHPIDLMGKFKPMSIDPWSTEKLSDEQRETLKANIELCRDYIIFFTACGSASGYGGHTGGAYDTVPETLLMEAFFTACPDKFHIGHYDEAGHRVATQYMLSVLHGDLDQNHTVNYRVGHSKLPGHPERGFTPGVKFSSGRLGHMWGHVNGVALQDPSKTAFMLGSDGSQMEGNDAESARLAVAKKLNVKLMVDDNDVTIAGHPSDYLKGYDVEKTLAGHGLATKTINPEDVDELYAAMRESIMTEGPYAVICKRPMAVGIKSIEGECHGHDAIAVKYAIDHFESKGMTDCIEALGKVVKTSDPQAEYLGSGDREACRRRFGAAVANQLNKMSAEEKVEKVKIIDCDLEGSTGLNAIRAAAPEIFFNGGIQERGNFEACAGFGSEPGKQGIFSTFAAFQEMVISELTMARLNYCNVLSHFSHSGSDDMADNTCHFGINNYFADNGIQEIDEHHPTLLFFPTDAHQMEACVEKVFPMDGLRFIYSTRSATPYIQDEAGNNMFEGKPFELGKDNVIREGKDGYVVTYGDATYRALDAVERLRKAGHDVGLISKPCLNVVDEETMKLIGGTKFCLVVEPMSEKTGLGMRFGTWLLQRGYTPKYANIGVTKEGPGGLWEHAYHQGYDAVSIYNKLADMINNL